MTNAFKRTLVSKGLAGLFIKLSFVSAQRAFKRQPWACIAGLISGWTALFVALWVAMLCAVLGAIGGFFTIGLLSFGLGQASQGLDLAGAAAGFGAGFLDGFLWIFGGSLAAAGPHVLLSIIVGAFLALLLTSSYTFFEPVILDFHSYRRPSRRAQEGALQPLLREVGQKMGLDNVPHLLINDSPAPGVWTYLRHIVMSKGLIDQMDEDELAGIMAHELHHWSHGDPVTTRFVWGCTFPLVVLINFYRFLFNNVDSVQKKYSAVGWVLVWPAFVLVDHVVGPLSAASSRRQEYEADAGAIAAGYGPGLASALAKQKDFEIARSGWEEALLRTHPPIEFRLEAIEEALATAKPARRATAASGAGKATNGRSRQSARSTGSAAG
jgi:Zn-dependent protease with chaperone function